MERAQVSEKVTGLLVEHLGITADRVKDDANLVDDLEADSLDVIELVMAFENEFRVEISDDECDAIQTVGQAIDLIECKLVA